MFKYKGLARPRKLRAVREQCTGEAPCLEARYHAGGHETGRYRARSGDLMICYECRDCHKAWEIAE